MADVFHLFSASILKSHKKQHRQYSAATREVVLSSPHYAYESLTEGCYTEFAQKDFELDTEYKLESAQIWITFPGKHQVKYPLQTIMPKVQMIRQVPLKQLPRDVEVDRRRRLYSKVRISDLLRDQNIQNSQLIPPEEVPENMAKVAFERNFFLPLHIFDDENFDSNTADGWLETGFVEGQRHPLPAWGLIMSADGKYSWEMVAVYSYNEDSFQFTVIDLAHAATHQVYRIHLMFMAESPYLFVERIGYALRQRSLSELKIRYEALIDCIMYDGAPPMHQLLFNRVLKLSLVDRKSIDDLEIVLQSMTSEVRLNYQRVMTSYVFENFLKNNPSEFPYIQAPKRVKAEIKQLPCYSTKADVSRFKNTRKKIKVITLFYVAESNQAMMNAASECIHIESFSLFVHYFAKTVALPDFVNNQESNCSQVVKFLKNSWPEGLAAKICLCLRSIGKGWLDLTVSDWNVFKVAKISRFFLQVKFRMQESLQALMEKSILGFSHLLNDPCEDFLDLPSDYVWENDHRTTPFDRLELAPVFKLILQIRLEGPFYSTDPEQFEPTLTKLFYSTLMSTCGIRIIDPDSLLHLNFAKNLYIFTVELIEEMYIVHDARLHASYSKAVIPLNAYLRKYERFVDFHELNVDNFIDNFANSDKSSQETKNEIVYQKEQKEELREILPEIIIIGPFQIVVEPLKRYLVNKRIEIVRKLFLYYVDRMFKINEVLLEELLEINGRLHEKLVSIEHLFEIREYMTLVPDKLVGLRERIQVMMLEYGVLDSFFYNLSDIQFNMKWEAFAWPHKISKRLIIMKEEHKNDIEEFKRIQIRELASFQERLESLNEEIMTFALQFDPEKVLEVSADTKKMWKVIQELQKTGTLLQDRQVLFESDELSLDYLDSIITSFNPYRSLWTACADFVKLEEITIGNPLTTIDLNEIRESLAELKRILENSVEVFAEKEEVKNVATVFLTKMEEFNPTLETMDCIKNEHWLVMHWSELSQKAGIEIKYSMTMNFAYCIKKGILNHVPLVKDIAERAVLEADAIRMAMEEEERLRLEAELALLERKANRKCRTDIL